MRMSSTGKRVEEVRCGDLRRQLQEVVDARHFYRKDDFVQIDGVWWVCEIRGAAMVMITCYGRSDFDLPRAVKWARLHDDRIKLDGTR